jgi:hypothetical protein
LKTFIYEKGLDDLVSQFYTYFDESGESKTDYNLIAFGTGNKQDRLIEFTDYLDKRAFHRMIRDEGWRLKEVVEK